MNEKQIARGYFSFQSDDGLQSFLPGLIISFFLHLMIFAFVLYSPGGFFKKKINPITLNVNLVSLPQYSPEPELPASKGTLKKKKTQPKPADAKPVEPVKKVVTEKKAEFKEKVKETVQTPPKEKISLKKQTFKSGEAVKPVAKEVKPAAREEVKAASEEPKKTEESSSDSVAEALARLRENLDETAPEVETEEEEGGGGVEGGYRGSRAGSGSGTQALSEMEMYLLQVKVIFNQNWAFSGQLAGQTGNIETIVVCTILPNGNIGDIWFEKRSGNAHLDDSAYKAILKSGPLPPLPPGMTQSYTAGYVFTPSGAQ